MLAEITSPPLPSRNRWSTSSIRSTSSELQDKDLPQVPHSENTIAENDGIKFKADDSLSFISAVRQQELYSLPMMNEAFNGVINDPTFHQHLVVPELTTLAYQESDQFWNTIIHDYSDQWIRRREVDKLEAEILKGITPEYRSVVYLKTLQVRYKFSQDHTFGELLKRSSKTRDSLSNLSDKQEVIELVLLALDVHEDLEANLPFAKEKIVDKYLINVAELLTTVPELSEEKRFFILTKLYKLYSSVNQEEFMYKVNRSLEDKLDSFKHIASQGINWSAYYKKLIPELIWGKFDQDVSFKILDLIVFEGFDFLLRLILWTFLRNDTKLASLSGDDLLTFIQSQEFYSESINLEAVLELEPPVITYENEFYLMEANSLSNNKNELRNLNEVHDELVLKINNMKIQIEELQSTHTEISQQSEEYNVSLTEAELKRKELIAERDQLQKKYEHLTMKENLANTIKANQEFSQRNRELQQQLQAMKQSIEDKKHKMAKAMVNNQ